MTSEQHKKKHLELKYLFRSNKPYKDIGPGRYSSADVFYEKNISGPIPPKGHPNKACDVSCIFQNKAKLRSPAFQVKPFARLPWIFQPASYHDQTTPKLKGVLFFRQGIFHGQFLRLAK